VLIHRFSFKLNPYIVPFFGTKKASGLLDRINLSFQPREV
jgi:hypothetical protein